MIRVDKMKGRIRSNYILKKLSLNYAIVLIKKLKIKQLKKIIKYKV